MKVEISKKRNCGTQIQEAEASPAQEILNESGEIFSCGGVYLGLNRQMPPFNDKFGYLHLPNYPKDVLVLNNLKIHRLPGHKSSEGMLRHSGGSSSQDTLRRFFKESLN